MKPVGKPDAGNRHVRFDERGRETGRRFGVSARARPRLYQVFGCNDVAQALMPAASALMPALRLDTVSPPRTGVEMSLWTPDLYGRLGEAEELA